MKAGFLGKLRLLAGHTLVACSACSHIEVMKCICIGVTWNLGVGSVITGNTHYACGTSGPRKGCSSERRSAVGLDKEEMPETYSLMREVEDAGRDCESDFDTWHVCFTCSSR